MDSLDIPQMLAFIESLQTAGVEEFEGFGFRVRFAASCFSPERIADQNPGPEDVMRGEPEARHDIHTLWDSPVLWPGGKRPSFPGAK